MAVEKKTYMSIFLTCSLWLIISQLIFVIIQKNQSVQFSKSIEIQFREELKTSNFLYLSRIVSDLTNNNSISCASLYLIENQESRQIIKLNFSNDCEDSIIKNILLNGENVAQTLTALNGEVYNFRYRTVNSDFFYLSIWLFRIFGILLILLSSILLRFQAESERKISIARIELARQVSHDIRSPLSALNLVLNSIQNIEFDQKKLIENSIYRINHISNELLVNSKLENSAYNNIEYESHINLSETLKNLIDEKKSEYSQSKNLKIIQDFNCDTEVFVAMKPSTLQRLFSNLINNSIESMNNNQGEVIISLRIYSNNVEITITDSGSGIPDHILSKLGAKNITSKTNGNGLGFYHAKCEIEKNNGSISISSRLDVGTMVKIILPIGQKTGASSTEVV